MLKLDREKTREALRQSIEKYPHDGRPEHWDYVQLMRRSADAQAALSVFCIEEIERDLSDPAGGFARIAAVVASAVFGQMLNTKDDDDPDGHEATHAMIHVMIDSLSQFLHKYYAQISEGLTDLDNPEHAGKVEVVWREVGDA